MGMFFFEKNCHRISEISCLISLKAELLYNVCQGRPCICILVNTRCIHFIGFATFNPVAASPLIGFGSPPKNVQIKFSILDMFGLQDRTIPYSEETSEGIYYLFLLSIFGLGR